MAGHKDYLGDGAYVDVGCYEGEVVLTTENGISVQNRVVLGMDELRRLLEWLRAPRFGVGDDARNSLGEKVGGAK